MDGIRQALFLPHCQNGYTVISQLCSQIQHMKQNMVHCRTQIVSLNIFTYIRLRWIPEINHKLRKLLEVSATFNNVLWTLCLLLFQIPRSEWTFKINTDRVIFLMHHYINVVNNFVLDVISCCCTFSVCPAGGGAVVFLSAYLISLSHHALRISGPEWSEGAFVISTFICEKWVFGFINVFWYFI